MVRARSIAMWRGMWPAGACKQVGKGKQTAWGMEGNGKREQDRGIVDRPEHCSSTHVEKLFVLTFGQWRRHVCGTV